MGDTLNLDDEPKLAPAVIEAAAASVRIGTFVTYTDTQGHEKLALVIGDPWTIQEGTSVEPLTGSARHLDCVRVGGDAPGSWYFKPSVPAGNIGEVNTWHPIV